MTAGVTIVLVALVTLSPLAFRGLLSFPGINWATLSNVGQTYGAVSALLAALALSGVVVSIFFQVRESRYNRIQVARARQFDLARLAMDNPFYLEVFAPFG